MRITFNMQAMRYQQSIASSLSSLTEASDRVNNKRNLLSPEQDASSYISSYNVQRMIDELTQFGTNAESAASWLKDTDSKLQEAISLLQTASKNYAQGGLDATDEESRKALAKDVQAAYDNLMDIANSSFMGKYIFGGFATSTKPFSDGNNVVSGVISSNNNGGDASARIVFGDLPELESGRYTAKISVQNGIGTLQLIDEKGKAVILDSNGSDESGIKGNNSATTVTFKYVPGGVVNTGRGVSFKMPDTEEASVQLNFKYQSGSEVSYNGDSGSIFSKIGYNQDVAINIPGSGIFTQSYKTLQGTRFNTVSGMAATLGALFSQLDNSNINIGDSISVSGTDHNGHIVGSAAVTSPDDPKLDLSASSEKERTLTLGYGDKLYKIVIPKGAYKTSEDLTDAINNQLKNAEYLGTLGDLPGGMGIDAYAEYVKNKIASGNYEGETDEALKRNNSVDLSGEIKVTADGDRLRFGTNKAGDRVRLSVTGGTQNALGFDNLTLAAEGKDTVFETGYDFHKDYIEQIKTVHMGMDMKGAAFTFYVNGKLVSVTKPAATLATTNLTVQDLNGVNDYSFTVKGKDIRIPAAELAAAATVADKTALLNRKISEAGLGAEAMVSNMTVAGANFDFDITETSQSKKEIELAFDRALKAAGFGFGVNVSLEGTTPAAPGDLGTYNVSFALVNDNSSRTTRLTTTFYDAAATPPLTDMKTAYPDKTGIGSAKENTLGDYVNFLKNLYGDSVDVSLENGKLTVKDIRSGESKLTMNVRTNNEGVSHAADATTVIGGQYTGTKNDEWQVSLKTSLGPSGSRNVEIAIRDKAGNVIYNKVTENYIGGEITLPYGITLTPSDMGLPDPDPTVLERTTTFSLDLKADSSLAFGDMNVIENGKNVNIFRSLKNLENALYYNITKNGFSEPTAWKDQTLKSSAKPFMDGVFRGNFNDNWNYEIKASDKKNDFYIQNEYKDYSGAIRFDAGMAAALGEVLSFGIDVYDGVSGKNQRLAVNIDLSKARPPITNPASAQDYILKSLNDDERFIDLGIKFTDDNGKIRMDLGSGTRIANFANDASGPARVFTSYVMGFETAANATLDFPLDVAPGGAAFQISDPGASNAGGDDPVKTITLPAGNYASREDLLNAVNAQLSAAVPGGTGGRIRAETDSNGGLKFVTSDGSSVEAAVTVGDPNPLGIALETDPAGNMATDIFASGAQTPKTDLSEASEEERTLNIEYVTGVPPVSRSVSLTLDKKAYASPEEMAEDINSKLTAAGIARADMKVVVTSGGNLAFSRTNHNFSGITVQGDYAGTLGFPKAGDSVKVKVSDSSGSVIQEVSVDTANKSVYVAEGLRLGFDAGSLYATDSFSSAVGSGISSEISALDEAENQILEALSIVGNRGSRAEAALNFQSALVKNNENVKARFLGSTEIDQAQALTDWKLANTAYESALSVTAKIMSVSLLDFLN